MVPTLLATVTAGLLSGYSLAAFSRGRSADQPVGYHPDEERATLAAVLAHPELYPMVSELAPGHFVDLVRAELWGLVGEQAGPVTVPEGRVKRRDFLALGEAIPADLRDRVRAAAMDHEHGDELVAGLDALPEADHDPIGRRLVKRAGKVYSAALDREEYVGRATIEASGDAAAPLAWNVPELTRGRIALASLLAGSGALAAVLLAYADGDFSLFGLLALLVLAAGSVVWTLVDLDTLMIDIETFWPLCGASWLLAGLAGYLATGHAWLAVTGLVTAGAVVVFIELVNRLFALLRGVPGMGSGDYILMLATIGVPVAITGDWELGYWVMMASLVSAIFGWVVVRLRNPGSGHDVPFAFGPYLACGWIIASVAHALVLA